MTSPAASGGIAWLAPDWTHVAPPVRALTTCRTGGVSRGPYSSLNLAQHVGDDPAAVMTNRARLRESVRAPSEPLWLEQVHGIDVVVHSGHAELTPPRADAAVAFAPGFVCAVMTADCLPVVLADREGSCIGIAHAGWRGLAAGIVEATVAALRMAPARLVAWLGPALSQPAFEVGPEVRETFLEQDAATAAAFERNDAGRYQADLYRLARLALARAGVHDVTGGGRCTSREDTEFYSYRRDRGRTGRMATLAWLE